MSEGVPVSSFHGVDIAPADLEKHEGEEILRVVIEHCSLFALTVGLKVVEIYTDIPFFGGSRNALIPQAEFRRFGLEDRPQADGLDGLENWLAAVGAFDVMIVGRICQGFENSRLASLIASSCKAARPNAIFIFVGKQALAAERSSSKVFRKSLERSFSLGFPDLCYAQASYREEPWRTRLSSRQSIHYCVLMRHRTKRIPRFSNEDYSFELQRSFGDALSKNGVFGVFKGKWNLIVGRSGCGKTTFLKALQGDLPYYTSGPKNFPARRYFNMPQNVDVFDNLSPMSNVRAYGGTASEARAYFAELGMSNDFQTRQKASQISGGERQRLLLAQIFAANPEFIILDEPSKGLDRAGRMIMFRALDERFGRSKHALKKTVVCADHDFAAIYTMFDFVFELRGGELSLVWHRESLV